MKRLPFILFALVAILVMIIIIVILMVHGSSLGEAWDTLWGTARNVTPASLKYAIEKTIADRMGSARTMNFKWVIGIIAIIMAGVLGFIMVMSFAPSATPMGATPEQVQQICAAACETMRPSGGSGGGFVG